jgi:SprT protein
MMRCAKPAGSGNSGIEVRRVYPRRMQRDRDQGNEAGNPALERATVKRTGALVAAAAIHFRRKIAAPEVTFDLRGRSAGQVRVAPGRRCLVRYNLVLLLRHPREFLAQTVPHEAAHVVVFALHGPGCKPHGPEWQGIMRLFGARPERCHGFEVEDLQTRRLQLYDYRCQCRAHRLSSIRHRRAEAGQTYLCRYCGHPLRMVRPDRLTGNR